MGNVQSVYNAFQLLEENIEITDNSKTLANAEAIILPGVGAFSDGMRNLKERGLIEVLQTEVVDKKKPYLGICLGLEFLAKKSFEGGEHEGLGWINGVIEKIVPNDKTLKVPHMGWNDTKVLKKDGLLKEMEDPVFYYLHSYYLNPAPSEKDVVTSVCDYGEVMISSTIQKDNIYAVQFHPEKSQSIGIKLLKNFVDEIRR